MKTVDIKFLELCDEIDYWKKRCFEAERELERIQFKYDKSVSDSINHGNKMMSNFLKLALTTSEDQLKKAFKEKK